MQSGLFYRTFFDFLNPRRNRDDDPRTGFHHRAFSMHLLDEVPQHRFGHLEVGDHTIFQRTNGDDVAWSSPEHPLGLVSDGEHLASPGLNGNDGGLSENNSVIFD